MNEITVDAIGNRIGNHVDGRTKVIKGFKSLWERRLLVSIFLFIMDRCAAEKQAPDNPLKFEDPPVRRIDAYSKEKMSLEWMLTDDLLEEGVSEGLVEKIVTTRIIGDGDGDTMKEYRIPDKAAFRVWLGNKRENGQSGFTVFRDIFSVFDDSIVR